MKSCWLKIIVCFLSFFAVSLTYAASDIAVVLIDMQEGYMGLADEELTVPLIERQLQILDWAVQNQHAIMVFEMHQWGETNSALLEIVQQAKHKQVFIKDASSGFLTKAIRKINPKNTTYDAEFIAEQNIQYPKGSRPDAKQDLPFRQLKDWGIRKLIVVGVNGGSCVSLTIAQALKEGLEVYTSADAVADVNARVYPHSRWWLKHSDDANFFPFHKLEDLTQKIDSSERVTRTCNQLF